MAKNEEKTKVTRITASDQTSGGPKAERKPKARPRVMTASTMAKGRRSFGPLGKIGGYFKGAWAELRQVHWPTRRATWGLTSAVLLFSAFFVVFITLLDAGFKYVFEQILR